MELRSVRRRIVAIALVLVVILSAWAGWRLLRPTPGPSGSEELLLLNEVRFLPAANESQFVELKNAGTIPVALAGISLANATNSFALPAGAGTLAVGQFSLVLFDGLSRIEPGTIHASRASIVDPVGDVLALRDGAGRVRDTVTWGRSHLGGVRLGPGGRIPDPVPGMTIGRFPLSRKAGDPREWFAFGRELASPGSANPVPVVGPLLPVDGVILPARDPHLSWYPVPGAAQYRVEVSSDRAFRTVVADRMLSGPPLAGASIPTGSYFWRVQAIESDGSTAAWSVVAAYTTVSGPLPVPPATRGGNATILNVPPEVQAKDTRMALLESRTEIGAHAWNASHPATDWGDPADATNCVLAGISMVTNADHLALGDGKRLSQDRVGYEVLHALPPAGPEGDLMWGRGMYDNETMAALAWATGAPPEYFVAPFDANALWDLLRGEIDAHLPVPLGVFGAHMIVVVGYDGSGPERMIYANDPEWIESTPGENAWTIESLSNATNVLWRLGGGTPTADEPGIAQDTDGDGLVNFDEVQRFHTDPNASDTDGDGVPDGIEVRASVFDPNWGYAMVGFPCERGGFNWTELDVAYDRPPGTDEAIGTRACEEAKRGITGRDRDADGLAMELDSDSDAGGCTDGREDANRNGVRDAAETSNFDPEDDGCAAGQIAVTIRGRSSHPYASGNGVIKVRVNITAAAYDTNLGYGDPMPNATYDWRAVYDFTGNGSILLDSSGYQLAPNGSWDYHDSYHADCAGNLSGTLAFLYNATDRILEVGFRVSLNETCPVDNVFQFSDGRFQNATRLLSGPNGANDFLASSFAWGRMLPTCGDSYYGAVCPVGFANRTADLEDTGPVDTTTFGNYLADSFGLWDLQDWDCALTFRIGHH